MLLGKVLAALPLLAALAAAPALRDTAVMSPEELELALAAAGAAKTPCHGCGHACDANCNCGVCTTTKCRTEALCMGPCNSGHNAKWCAGGPAPAPAPGPAPGPAPAPQPSGQHFTADLSIKQCDRSGCKPITKRVALDATSNCTSAAGESLIAVGGAARDELTLTYGGPGVGGPRVYLIEEEGVNRNTLFMLKGKEFTFEVELSTLPCGFNAALYFIGMDANQGGAENGTNYCDAQAVDDVLCSEMDVLEANTVAQQYTTHACTDACASYNPAPGCKGRKGTPSNVCDQNGCGMNPFRYGPGTTYNNENNNLDWYGPGKTLDSTQPFTVVTQFHESATKGLDNITRFYFQKGKRVDLPTLYVVKPRGGGQRMGPFANPALTEPVRTCTF